MNERLGNTLLMIKSFANFKRANCDYKSDHDSSKRTFFSFFFFFLQCGINGVERGAWASSAPWRGLPTKTTRRAAILDERSLFST